MFVQTSSFEIPVDKIDALIPYFRQVALPEDFADREEMELLVDREHGLLRVITHWSSREALDSYAEKVKALQSQGMQEFEGLQQRSMEVYEVVVHEGQLGGHKTA